PLSLHDALPISAGHGGYVDPRTGTRTTWQAAKAQAARALSRVGPVPVEPPWLLEELVTDHEGVPACDWRMYTFGGKVEVTLQTLADGKRWLSKWWDGSWSEIGVIRPSNTMTYTPDLPAPYHPQALLEAAAAIHAHVDSPFLRVDLYDHPEKGPMFGEITPHPGGSMTKPFLPE